jgi:outer membrane protein TolC
LATPERVPESHDDSPGPMLRQPAVVAASHRRQDPPVSAPVSEYAAPVFRLPDDTAGSGTVSGQGRAPGARTRAETVDAPSALSAPLEVFEIDLPTTLRLMLSANPTMGEAREAVREMLALQTRARSMMLPTLNAGASYHKHEGNFQASTGQIKDIYSQAVYFGGGTRVWAAESLAIPAVRILGHVGDAIYEPLVVRQEVTAKRFDSASTSNTVLLQAIVRYFELLAAEARYEAARQTEREAAEIVRITAAYAVTGQGREGDSNRARAEAYLMHVEVQRAEERIAVASARLAELLSLDPSTRLKTIGGPIGGVELVDPNLDLQTLIRMAERRRPELAAASAMVGANSTRVRQEQTRPLFPLLMVGFSAGSFGGGSVLFPPKIGNFGGRNDFDALAVWSLNNMGVGNVATVSERRAVLNQSIAQRTRALNGIRQEVIAAYGLLRGESLQIRITQRQLKDTEEGFREEFARLRGAEALPIEVLNSVDQLGTARQELIKAVTAYNQAQFRLFVAAGVSPSRIVQDGSAASQAVRNAAPADGR